MKNSNFNPFQSIEAIKAQGYNSSDLRNFAFKGLESANTDDYLDFIKEHQNNLFLQELFYSVCNMSSEEALNYLQVESSTSEFVVIIKAACNQLYVSQCQKKAYILENLEKSESTQNEIKMIEAVKNNDLESVKECIKNGLDVNTKDVWGDTPLISASHNGHLNIAKFLIEHGADVNAKNDNDDTALMYASENAQFETAKLLVEYGADVNAQDKDGWTPLMDSVWRGNLDIAKLLIEHGADVNAKNNDGNTALDEYSILDERSVYDEEMKAFLIANGAKKGKELENSNEESQTIRKRR